MKKPKLIPAFLNRLTYYERMYVRYSALSGLILGAYIVWFIALTIPGFTESKTLDDQYAWKIYGMFPLLVSLSIVGIKQTKYKKLIKLEPRIKQTKPDDIVGEQ